MVEGLAQFVHGEFLEAEQDRRFHTRRQAAAAYCPPRNLRFARVAAAGEHAERPAHEGMRQVQQGRIRRRQEHVQAAHALHEGRGVKDEARHRAQTIRGLRPCPQRFIHHVAPAGQIRLPQAVEAVWLGGQELRAFTGCRQRGFQGFALGCGVQTQLLGEGCRCGDFRCRGGAGAAQTHVRARRLEARIQGRLHRGGVFAVNQAAVDGVAENLVQGAQVFADLVRLAHDVVQKAQVWLRIADEVMHGHVAPLAVAVDAAVALFKAGGIPRAVVVQQVAGGAVQVQALGGRIRGDQQAHVRCRIVEGGLHFLAGRLVHAIGTAGAEQRQDTLRRIAFAHPAQEVVQRRLVLGEDDQPLFASVLVRRAQQAPEERSERIEPRIRPGRLLYRGRAFQIESEGGDGVFHPPNFGVYFIGVVLQPRAGDRGGGGGALLGFAIVAELLLPTAFGRP